MSETRNSNSSYCILVAPLLIENNLHELVDRVLVVDVSEKTQLERTLLRDTSSENEIKAIIASQVKRTERLKVADDVIVNEELINNDNGHIHAIEKLVLSFDKKYLTLTKMV